MGKCKDNKLQPNKADKGRNQGPSTAAKARSCYFGRRLCGRNHTCHRHGSNHEENLCQ